MPTTSSQEESSKQQKMHDVAESIFGILINFNVEDVSFARVARLAKVSRPWLYKYIGTKKEDLIDFGILYLGKNLTEKDLDEKIESREALVQSVLKGMERMFQNSEDYPFFIPVYFRYKGTNTAPGKAIQHIEQAYVKRQTETLLKIYKSFDRRQAEFSAELMTTFRMSMAFNWQRGDLKKKASKEEVLKAMEVYLRELFGPI